MSKYEKRTYNNHKVEIRMDDEGVPHIEGLGIVFNELSHDLGGFQERILPEAMEGVSLDDVYSFINHDPNNLMGRTKSGTMKIDVRDDGVYYSVKPPKAAKQFVENIQRGDIDGSSFMFRVSDDTWEEREDGLVPLRTIKKFDSIKEIGAVITPAYPQTSTDIALRSMQEWRDDNEKVDPPKPEMDEATKMKGDVMKSRKKFNIQNKN